MDTHNIEKVQGLRRCLDSTITSHKNISFENDASPALDGNINALSHLRNSLVGGEIIVGERGAINFFYEFILSLYSCISLVGTK